MAREVGQLDYAPLPAWPQRRTVRRWLTLALMLVVGLLAAKWAPVAWNHVRLIHYQSKCLEWAAPTDRLLYHQPQVGAPAPEWSHFYRLLSPPGGKPAATIFAHEFRHKDGSPRLIVVEVPLTASNNCNYEIDLRVIRPGGIWTRPQLLWQDTWLSAWYFGPRNAPDGTLRLYAGQPDPADRSHFTIRYAYRDQEGTLDGWLQANDTILLEPRVIESND